MLNWLFEKIYKKKLDTVEEKLRELKQYVELAEKEKLLCLRHNVTCLDYEDMDSLSFKSEISAMWKSNTFQFLLHITRQGFIHELVKGQEAAGKNVQGMIKGIDALAIKMQEINLSVKKAEL